jgi:zinc protease
VISGDFEPTATLSLVEKYFGPIAGGPKPPRASAAPVALTESKYLDIAADVALPRVYVAWPTPAFLARGDAELDMAADILAHIQSSRLMQQIVYGRRVAEDVSAHQESRQLGSIFQVTATARPGHTADEVLLAIDQELEKLRRSGPTPDEIQRARMREISERIFMFEKDGARAHAINLYNEIGHDPGLVGGDLAAHERVTEADVRDAVRNYLPGDRRVVAVVTPEKGAPVSGRLRGGRP